MRTIKGLSGSTWTIFGLGYFFFEVSELIEILGGKVKKVVINQPIPDGLQQSLPRDIIIEPLTSFSPTTDHFAFGFTSPNKDTFLKAVANFKLSFPNLIHPSSILSSSVSFGLGNLIQPGVVIGTRTQIGNFNILNRCSSVGHDVSIGNLNHLGPNAAVCGRVTIGNQNFIGAGAVVIDQIEIGNQCILGAGGVAVNHFKEPGTYVGIPAKRI